MAMEKERKKDTNIKLQNNRSKKAKREQRYFNWKTKR